MNVKIFDVVLHNGPAGKSPATHLEEQINNFLKHYPNLQIVATHMNRLVVPSEPVTNRVRKPNPVFGPSLCYSLLSVINR